MRFPSVSPSRLRELKDLCLRAGLIRVLPTMQVDASPSAPPDFSEPGVLAEKLQGLAVADATAPSSTSWDHIFACGDCANVKEIKVSFFDRLLFWREISGSTISSAVVRQPSMVPGSDSGRERTSSLKFSH